MSGGKGAWERAASSVDARVTLAAGSTLVGVCLCLFGGSYLFLFVFFATRVAWDVVFVEFSTGL